MYSMLDEGSGNACKAFSSEEIAELREIVRINAEAGNTLTKLTIWIGSKIEGVADVLMPESVKKKVDEVIESVLKDSFALAQWSSSLDGSEGWVARAKGWATGEVWHRWASAATGAVGGFFGLPGALIELPFTTTLILRAIIEVAEGQNLDLNDPAIRAQCLRVFALGGPSNGDDDADTGLWATRAAFGGAQAAELIPKIAARFGITMSETVAAKAVPILGAGMGAAINASFTTFYQSMAHVHFRLMKLESIHDPEEVHACFDRITLQYNKSAEAGSAAAEARDRRRP